jgi:glutamate synthase (NADPH/NADH) small chain
VFGADVGESVEVAELRERHDALVLATGSRVPRDLPVPGRELDGVHFAMEYLYARQRGDATISAAGKHVIVIGGGDTGADCVGNAVREGAASITQLELLPEPPAHRPDDRTPWPMWPQKLRLSYAMEEAQAIERGETEFSIVTTHFAPGEDGAVGALHYAQAQDAPPFAPVPGTEGELPAQLVLLAMGFLHPEHEGAVEQLGVDLDQRGNVKAGAYATSVEGVFAAGDARRGQSLIVWAINEGRQCARVADRYLEGLGPIDPDEEAVEAGALGPEAGPPLHARYGVEVEPEAV